LTLVLIILYGAFLGFIFLYSLIQLSLTVSYVRSRKKKLNREVPVVSDDLLPIVTVQLPVFNELYVVERLVDAVAALDYPKDKLEIQLLDDSDDESFEVGARKVAELQKRGIDIQHIKRPNRVGFKAGALAYGLGIAKGEFTAIFDADFIPNEDFLRQTIPFMVVDEGVGVVQTKWEHLNEQFSLLTKLQAFGLDAHFTVEQRGRNSGGHFINFNGTAGVWRNACIAEAGGWQSDTITEDLDLSYRAQLKGWRFIFLEGVGSPAELPAEMNALKNQQFRWTKGAAECAVKNLPKVLLSKELSFRTKIHAVFHLMNSFVFICVICTALLSIPMLLIKQNIEEYHVLFNLASLFLLSFVILSIFYWVSRPKDERRLSVFLVKFPLFLSMSMGLSLHNAIAVIEGYVGRKTPFIRTPKFAIQKAGGTWKDKKYRALKSNPLTIVEGLLAIYFLGGIVLGIITKEYGLIPFHIMLTLGFGYIFYYSLSHTRATG
jgi:cellulose synthase/poly-beta-1,6-N-acetylglucosamine synthase-like glycosyltransferase